MRGALGPGRGRAGVDDLRLVGLGSRRPRCSLSALRVAASASLISPMCVAAAPKRLRERVEAGCGSLAVDHAREWLGGWREELVDHVQGRVVVAVLQRGQRHVVVVRRCGP